MQQQRSTKGASKQRRDCINVEINQIKDVLPVSDNVRRRLSQLQVMALCNSYINKSNCFLNALSINDGQSYDESSFFDFSEALPGFLLAITSDGRLLYISENVTEYLGHSMVELMTQAETIYDIIERGDETLLREFLVRSKIKHDTVRERALDELDFTCRVNLARLFRRNNVFDRQKMIKIHGRFIWPEGELHLAEPIFVARCSPVLSPLSTEQPAFVDTTIFQTSHSLDMKYTNIEENGEFYLGYDRTELIGASWYQFIHPDDTQEACRKHTELLHGGLDTPRSLVARVQNKYGAYMWLHMVMYLGNSMVGPLGLESNQQEIFCLNHVLNERDALETKHREKLEMLMMQGQQRGVYETPVVSASACIPTVVVDDQFMEPVTTQTKISAPRDSQEIRERIKVITMEKMRKKPRMGDVQTYSGASQHGLESFMKTDPYNNGLSADLYGMHGPLTPPFSDDGKYDQIPTSLHSPRSNLAYTPPYSPPSSLDDASLFDAIQQQKVSVRKVYDGVKKPRQVLHPIHLPELDESTVLDFFQDVEGKDSQLNQSSAKLNQRYQQNNAMLTSALLEEMSRQNQSLEFDSVHSDGNMMQMMYENAAGMTGESFTNLLSAAPFAEESFLDLIESPLSLNTIDPSTLQFLNSQQLIM